MDRHPKTLLLTGMECVVCATPECNAYRVTRNAQPLPRLLVAALGPVGVTDGIGIILSSLRSTFLLIP